MIDTIRENNIPVVFSESTVSDQAGASRSPARPAPNTAASSTSTRSARPTARCRPISTCCSVTVETIAKGSPKE